MARGEPLCENTLLLGYTVDGGFQQHAIGKAAHFAKIPEGGPLDVIATILCAAVTVCTR